MRLRNTIIVLVLFAIVGGYAFVVGHYSVTEEKPKLIDVKQDDIAKIELKYSDRDIVLERDKGKPWRLVKPVGTDADQTQANNLARAIADGVLVRTVDDKPADLAPFGLKPPTTTVTVTTFDNKTLPSIEVGKSTPIGFNAYVRLSNSPAVLLTEGAFSAGMNKTVNDLRVRDLMAFKIDDVQKLIIARDNGDTVEIDRDGDNWKIVKPAPSPADDTAVRMALGTLVNARATDFVSDAPANVAQYGLEKPHSDCDGGAQERRAAIDAVRVQAGRRGQERNLRASRRARAGLRGRRIRDDQPGQVAAGFSRQDYREDRSRVG